MSVADRGPLAGLKVLELGSEVPAAYCARQFAAWGADVVVVEPTGGSALRRLPPFASGPAGDEISLLWENVAANKRTVTVEDDAALRDLLAAADVLVTDAAPDWLAARGVRLDRLEDEHPGLCVVSITPFGLSGPYAGWRATPLILEALSGYLGLNGWPEREPLQAPGRLTSYAIGVNAFVAALAAYLKRERTGVAERVEVSGMETLASLVPFLRVQFLGTDKRREGGTEAGVRLMPCADGWLSMMVSNKAHRDKLAEVLEVPADAFPADLYEGGYAQVVRKTIAFYGEYTRRWKSEDLFYALTVSGLTCGKVMRPAELLGLDQLAERNFFRTVDHPELGELLFPGPPGLMRQTEPVRPAPPRQVAVSELDWGLRAACHPATDRASERPLEGLRVVDLTQAWIGPFTTLLFADLGAEVIKIESHRRPDVWRLAAAVPLAASAGSVAPPNRSWYFNSVNHNKRDLTLDLRTEQGKALFLRLVEQADIVAENFSPSVMASFGLDYPVLSQAKPDLVMMSASGYGKTGLWSLFKTNGSAIEAMAGWGWLHRYRDGPPVQMGFYQADPIDGLQMAALTIICLIRKLRTGEGEHIDGAMLDASVGYLGEVLLQAQLGGEPEPLGNRRPDMAPHGVFPCLGEDRWIAIAVDSDEAWSALAVEAFPGDASFDTMDARKRGEDELEARLSAWTRTQDADALMRMLQAAGVPAGVVRGVQEALEEPQLAARGWFRRLTRPDLGEHSYNGFAWRFAGCELRAELPPPRLGEHSEAVLKERLGLSDAEVAELKAKGVTGAVI